jgi:N-methylhydantoinase B
MTTLDPIELQVVTGALRAACEEMGVVLIRSAHSSNIKERRDASTALFDADGQMVMQAEHIPVHLGAMPAAVAAVLGEGHAPGVSWILNDPFAGGTHLPDITVITPVFAPAQPAAAAPTADTNRATASARAPVDRLIGFAANRAHHADVGALVPGSMPADSHSLEEEGVVISPRVLDEATLEQLTARMRQPRERRADLRAQLAANRTGAQRLRELSARVGVERLRAATDAVLDYSERRTRACLAALADGERRAEDVLEAPEGELLLRLRACVEGERLLLDFSGSARQHDGNLNCPLAVTRSACLFAVRVLTDPDIPPTAGAYRPIEVRAPAGTVLNARPGAAVAAGNVETSSRVADLVLAAFGHAQGQGTMNNLTLGHAGAQPPATGSPPGAVEPPPHAAEPPPSAAKPRLRAADFSYYETLGGGQGACADADGPSGVHVAMSNTLNTPIEALEREFPLRVVEYALRRGSGGAGRHRGGDGVVRELEALSEMTFSLIAERRHHAPRGAHGGEPGACGRDLLDGRPLRSKITGTLQPGQRLRIETPGGGGFGDAREPQQ